MLRKGVDVAYASGVVHRLILILLLDSLGLCVLTHSLLELLIQQEEVVLSLLLFQSLPNHWLLFVFLFVCLLQLFNAWWRLVFASSEVSEAVLRFRSGCFREHIVRELLDPVDLSMASSNIVLILLQSTLLSKGHCICHQVILVIGLSIGTDRLLDVGHNHQISNRLISFSDVLGHFIRAVVLLEEVGLRHFLKDIGPSEVIHKTRDFFHWRASQVVTKIIREPINNNPLPGWFA